MRPELREVRWDAVKSALRAVLLWAYIALVAVPVFAAYGLWWPSVLAWAFIAAADAVTTYLLLVRWRLTKELVRQREIGERLRERNEELRRLIVELDALP